jgi:hypothetical protein
MNCLKWCFDTQIDLNNNKKQQYTQAILLPVLPDRHNLDIYFEV